MASGSESPCVEWGQLGQASLKGEIPELQVNKSPIDPRVSKLHVQSPSVFFVEHLLSRTNANFTWVVKTQYCKGLLAFLMMSKGVKIDLSEVASLFVRCASSSWCNMLLVPQSRLPMCLQSHRRSTRRNLSVKLFPQQMENKTNFQYLPSCAVCLCVSAKLRGRNES